MIVGWAIEQLVARGWKSWQAKLAICAAMALIVTVAIGAIAMAIFHHGEVTGSAKLEKKQAKVQAQIIATARIDEGHAQDASSRVAADTGRKTDTTTAIVTAKRLEIKNAIDSTPRAAPGGAVPVIDGRVLSASVDQLIDGANRSAAAADAQP